VFEVIEYSTGCKMSAGFPQGTLHKSETDALLWMEKAELSQTTHFVMEVK
jgi:hypothetical protein